MARTKPKKGGPTKVFLLQILTMVLVMTLSACDAGGGSSSPGVGSGGIEEPPGTATTQGSINLNGPREGASVAVKGLIVDELNGSRCLREGYIVNCQPLPIGSVISDRAGVVEPGYNQDDIAEDYLYLVTFSCATEESACTNPMPNDLHVVLTAEQFREGG